jgi:hypothetical protein
VGGYAGELVLRRRRARRHEGGHDQEDPREQPAHPTDFDAGIHRTFVG